MKHMDIALSQIGTKEYAGSKHNKQILEYFKKSGHSWVKNDEMAWCAAFANWVLVEAGLKGSMELNARSFLKIGRAVKTPKTGDVVVLWREKKSGWKGHVGFFVSKKNGYIDILGGNQSDQVKVSRYPENRLLGYRRVVESTEEDTKPFDITNVSKADLLKEIERRLK